MDKIVIEITESERHLCVSRGFMLIKQHEEELGKVPMDDISCVITDSYGVTFSNNLLIALAERNIPLICCGKNHTPAALVWAFEGNYRQAACIDAQASASQSVKDRLWREIIRQKIANQAEVLKMADKDGTHLRELSKIVSSGDKENTEGRAAKFYWTALFGTDFKRDRNQEGANAILNYGYTVLRSLTSRAVMGAGLNPSLGIHHRNTLNPLRLVDDIMEPFRPVIDILVYHMVSEGSIEVGRSEKRALATSHFLPMSTSKINTTLGFCVRDLAVSVAKIFLKETEKAVFPDAVPKIEHIRGHWEKCKV